jgi:hypothetical protein
MLDFAANNYAIAEIRFPVCTCGSDRYLVGGEDGSCAMRKCVACKKDHLIADSEDYWSEADIEQCVCSCDHAVFQVGVGFALTKDKKDLRWIYVGMRCVECALAGVYLDWKIDYGPSLQLVDRA